MSGCVFVLLRMSLLFLSLCFHSRSVASSPFAPIEHQHDIVVLVLYKFVLKGVVRSLLKNSFSKFFKQSMRNLCVMRLGAYQLYGGARNFSRCSGGLLFHLC